MALVDLKSNLNKFRSEFKPDNPYEKSGREINELQSTVSSEGKSSLLDNVDTTAGTFIKGLKKFGIISVPLEDNYENSIKQGSIFYANPVASALTDAATGFETIRKAVKNFKNDPIDSIAKGLIT